MIRTALLCAVLAAGPCAAELSSRIAFVAFDNGMQDIHTIAPDGQQRRNLTNHSAHDWAPAWSPDGRRIAFISNRDAMGIVDPDARFNAIYIMNADGSDPARVTAEPLVYGNPTWSPDGTRLLFQVQTKPTPDRYISNLWIMDVHGGPMTKVIEHRNPHADDPVLDFAPSWSPLEGRIIFGSSPFSGLFGRDRVIDLFSYDIADGALTNLTNLEASGSNDQPVFSPDGQQIAFYSRRPDNEGIYVMAADGSNQTPITPVWTIDWNPTWSPDGRKIAFVSTRDRDTDIFIMNADGSDPINLTPGEGGGDAPAWSPLAEFPTAITESSWGRVKTHGRH